MCGYVCSGSVRRCCGGERPLASAAPPWVRRCCHLRARPLLRGGRRRARAPHRTRRAYARAVPYRRALCPPSQAGCGRRRPPGQLPLYPNPTPNQPGELPAQQQRETADALRAGRAGGRRAAARPAAGRARARRGARRPHRAPLLGAAPCACAGAPARSRLRAGAPCRCTGCSPVQGPPLLSGRSVAAVRQILLARTVRGTRCRLCSPGAGMAS